MKTLQDLVDTLNKKFDNEFDLFDKENGFEFCLRVDGAPIIDFNSRDKSFAFQSYIEYVYGRSLNMIVNFLANSNPSDWVPEKKYNIIIAKDIDSLFNRLCVYKKDSKGFIFTKDNATKIDLSFNDYQFTESEIEELKSTLPTNMAKIVDLGKEEVKDD